MTPPKGHRTFWDGTILLALSHLRSKPQITKKGMLSNIYLIHGMDKINCIMPMPCLILRHSIRAEQSFENHVEQVRNFIDRCGKSTGDDDENFFSYVIGRSAGKMWRRIGLKRNRRSSLFMKAIVELPAEGLQWYTHKSSPYNKHDTIFLDFFEGEEASEICVAIWYDLVQYRQSGFTWPEDPDHRRILGEIHNHRPESVHDLFPHLKSARKQHQAVYYTPETYRDFHRLLCLSLLGYRALVMALSMLRGKREKPEADVLDSRIALIHLYLATLHPMPTPGRSCTTFQSSHVQILLIPQL